MKRCRVKILAAVVAAAVVTVAAVVIVVHAAVVARVAAAVMVVAHAATAMVRVMRIMVVAHAVAMVVVPNAVTAYLLAFNTFSYFVNQRLACSSGRAQGLPSWRTIADCLVPNTQSILTQAE